MLRDKGCEKGVFAAGGSRGQGKDRRMFVEVRGIRGEREVRLLLQVVVKHFGVSVPTVAPLLGFLLHEPWA